MKGAGENDSRNSAARLVLGLLDPGERFAPSLTNSARLRPTSLPRLCGRAARRVKAQPKVRAHASPLREPESYVPLLSLRVGEAQPPGEDERLLSRVQPGHGQRHAPAAREGDIDGLGAVRGEGWEGGGGGRARVSVGRAGGREGRGREGRGRGRARLGTGQPWRGRRRGGAG